MFQPRREVLRAKSGSLTETPLPLLLHSILVEQRSATLELQLRNLVKQLHFEAGVPVGCDSNLLHESFGKYLVDKHKLTEAQHHALLAESAATDKPLQSVLLQKKLLSSFELFKLLQANLAHTLLDAFRWGEAKWKLRDLDEVATPIKMNTAQLVYLGAPQLPAEILTRHFAIDQDRPLALLVDELSEELKVPSKDLRLVQAIKKRASLGALLAQPNANRVELVAKVYALCVLELVDFEDVAASARPSYRASSSSSITRMPVESIPGPEPSPPTRPKAEDDPALLETLAAEFLSFRNKDAFELLGVTPETPSTGLAPAFLGKADALSPQRFVHPDARNRAESVLLAYARAYGALCDPDQHAVHRTRRENALSARKQTLEPHAAAEQFKIRTKLLDASAQFDEGKRRFESGQLQSAAEHFQYAADIEPNGQTLAYLAITQFRLAPDFAGERSLTALAAACQRDPRCEEAWAFRADLALGLSRHAEAAEAYREAMRINPKHPRYRQALENLKKKG